MSSCCHKKSNITFNNYNDVLAYLNTLGLFHMDMSLDRMHVALKRLNLGISCPIVQVVGTNGKGSTASFLHSLALAHGFHAGIFTSPHFLSPTERIRMNSNLLPESAWANLAEQALTAEPNLTYFELLTVISLLAFASSEPDILIYEAGLGGQFDATSAIGTNMLCISPIDLDHTAILGNDIHSITMDKMGAMHGEMFAVISAPQKKEASNIIEKKTKDLNIPLYNFDTMKELSPLAILDGQKLGLQGQHQRLNAQTALIAWQVICNKQGWFTEPNAIERGLAQTFIPGRFQYVAEHDDLAPLILDGAHNEHSMKSLVQALKEKNIRPRGIIFSCLSDKNPDKLITIIETFLEKNNIKIPILIPHLPNNERAIPPNELAKLFKAKATPTTNMKEALNIINTSINNTTKENSNEKLSDPILICGSLYLLAEYYTLYPQALKN